MTEVASRAAQSQSIVDTISRSGSSKPGAQTYRAVSRSTPKAHDADVADDQVRDRPGDKADVRDQRAASKSVDTSAKVSEKPHRENDGDDASETSFEATIDTLGSQTSSGNAQAATLTNAPASWNTAPAPAAAQDQTSNDGSQSAAPNVRSATIAGHILKQASVVALLDARQRLMEAQERRRPRPNQRSKKQSRHRLLFIRAKRTGFSMIRTPDRAPEFLKLRRARELRKTRCRHWPLLRRAKAMTAWPRPPAI